MCCAKVTSPHILADEISRQESSSESRVNFKSPRMTTEGPQSSSLTEVEVGIIPGTSPRRPAAADAHAGGDRGKALTLGFAHKRDLPQNCATSAGKSAIAPPAALAWWRRASPTRLARCGGSWAGASAGSSRRDRDAPSRRSAPTARDAQNENAKTLTVHL